MRTRSHSSSLAQSETLDRECDTESNGSHCNVIEVRLSRALKGAQELHKELAFLRKRNEALEARLESVEQAVDISIQPKRGKRSGPTVSKLQGDVRKLNSRIQQLEKARQKDRKKMDKLRMKEIKADAAELKADVEFEVGDSAYRMRKLLRRFHDLIISTSIEENEECPICMDNLENNNVATCPRDEIEVVQLTALQQWDALLDVAKAWARMDRRREEDTSEEEAEEEFIDDERSAINTSSSESALLGPLASSPEPEADGVHDEVEPQIQEAIPTPHKKRHIACTPDSLPEISGPEPTVSALDPPITHMTTAENIPHNATSVPDAPAKAATSTSDVMTPSPPATPSRTGVSGVRPYTQSPSAEKRKRMEMLAAERNSKRKRF